MINELYGGEKCNIPGYYCTNQKTARGKRGCRSKNEGDVSKICACIKNRCRLKKYQKKEETKPSAKKEKTKPSAKKEKTKPSAKKEETKPSAKKEKTKPTEIPEKKQKKFLNLSIKAQNYINNLDENQLRKELIIRNINPFGNKQTLVERLSDAMSHEPEWKDSEVVEFFDKTIGNDYGDRIKDPNIEENVFIPDFGYIQEDDLIDNNFIIEETTRLLFPRSIQNDNLTQNILLSNPIFNDYDKYNRHRTVSIDHISTLTLSDLIQIFVNEMDIDNTDKPFEKLLTELNSANYIRVIDLPQLLSEVDYSTLDRKYYDIYSWFRHVNRLLTGITPDNKEEFLIDILNDDISFYSFFTYFDICLADKIKLIKSIEDMYRTDYPEWINDDSIFLKTFIELIKNKPFGLSYNKDGAFSDYSYQYIQAIFNTLIALSTLIQIDAPPPNIEGRVVPGESERMIEEQQAIIQDLSKISKHLIITSTVPPHLLHFKALQDLIKEYDYIHIACSTMQIRPYKNLEVLWNLLIQLLPDNSNINIRMFERKQMVQHLFENGLINKHDTVTFFIDSNSSINDLIALKHHYTELLKPSIDVFIKFKNIKVVSTAFLCELDKILTKPINLEQSYENIKENEDILKFLPQELKDNSTLLESFLKSLLHKDLNITQHKLECKDNLFENYNDVDYKNLEQLTSEHNQYLLELDKQQAALEELEEKEQQHLKNIALVEQAQEENDKALRIATEAARMEKEAKDKAEAEAKARNEEVERLRKVRVEEVARARKEEAAAKAASEAVAKARKEEEASKAAAEAVAKAAAEEEARAAAEEEARAEKARAEEEARTEEATRAAEEAAKAAEEARTEEATRAAEEAAKAAEEATRVAEEAAKAAEETTRAAEEEARVEEEARTEAAREEEEKRILEAQIIQDMEEGAEDLKKELIQEQEEKEIAEEMKQQKTQIDDALSDRWRTLVTTTQQKTTDLEKKMRSAIEEQATQAEREQDEQIGIEKEKKEQEELDEEQKEQADEIERIIREAEELSQDHLIFKPHPPSEKLPEDIEDFEQVSEELKNLFDPIQIDSHRAKGLIDYVKTKQKCCGSKGFPPLLQNECRSGKPVIDMDNCIKRSDMESKLNFLRQFGWQDKSEEDLKQILPFVDETDIKRAVTRLVIDDKLDIYMEILDLFNIQRTEQVDTIIKQLQLNFYNIDFVGLLYILLLKDKDYKLFTTKPRKEEEVISLYKQIKEFYDLKDETEYDVQKDYVALFNATSLKKEQDEYTIEQFIEILQIIKERFINLQAQFRKTNIYRTKQKLKMYYNIYTQLLEVYKQTVEHSFNNSLRLSAIKRI